MSIIERAMGKQLGVEVSDEDSLPREQAPAEIDAAPTEHPQASNRRPKDVASLEERTGPAVESSATEKDSQGIESTSSKATGRADSQPESVLNFAELAENGFIDPTAGATRLTEEYQQIKRRIIGNTVEGMTAGMAPSNLVMITSSIPNEGKTFTTINLALSITMEVDRTVLVVDVDIVKSDLTKFFGLINRPGLYDLLGHPELDVGDVICKTNIPSLTVIPAGTDAKGITEKLASEGMKNLSLELANRYPDRLIIFDAPPVLATSSARAIAPYIGQTVLVVESCKTPAQTLKHALNVMEPLPIAGVVLNKARYRAGAHGYYYDYGYGYGYGYGAGDPPEQNKRASSV